MRKISIILTTLIVSANSIYAQSFTEIFDSLFVNINRTQATTGILYERVLPFACLNHDLPDLYDSHDFFLSYRITKITKIKVQTKKILSLQIR